MAAKRGNIAKGSNGNAEEGTPKNMQMMKYSSSHHQF
jgi:hypothetical protein